jgi:hypothetical protein
MARQWRKSIIYNSGPLEVSARVARFFLVQHTKMGENIPNNPKMYQIDKTIPNRPNGYIIYQHLPFQDPPKFTQIGIFGSKIYAIWQP